MYEHKLKGTVPLNNYTRNRRRIWCWWVQEFWFSSCFSKKTINLQQQKTVYVRKGIHLPPVTNLKF